MPKCKCILGSGKRKGQRCTYKSKDGSDYCGIHRNCGKSGAKESVKARSRDPPLKKETVARFPLKPIYKSAGKDDFYKNAIQQHYEECVQIVKGILFGDEVNLSMDTKIMYNPPILALGGHPFLGDDLLDEDDETDFLRDVLKYLSKSQREIINNALMLEASKFI